MAKAGGLHKFMNWKRALLTVSVKMVCILLLLLLSLINFVLDNKHM